MGLMIKVQYLVFLANARGNLVKNTAANAEYVG